MHDPLDRRATPRALFHLAEVGLLGRDDLGRALGRIDGLPTSASIVRAVRGLMGLLGALSLVAAVALLIAANMSAIPGPALIGGCMALVVVSGLGAARLGMQTRTGRVLALVSGLLIGPMLAVFGQVYQTGADAWQLFALWSVLLVGSVVATRHGGLVVLQMVLLHTTGVLVASQHFGIQVDDGPFALVVMVLLVCDAVVMAAWLRQAPVGSVVRLLLLLGLVTLAPTGLLVWTNGLGGSPLWEVSAGVGVAAAHGAAALVFWRLHRDVAALGLVGASVMVHLTTIVGWLVFEVADLEITGIFIIATAVIGQAIGLAIVLRRAAREAR